MNWVTSVPFVYPVLESVHIVGIALLLGSLVVFELRVWGLGRSLELRALARLALPLSLTGFALVLASGAVMFFSQVDEMLANKAFILKMALLALAGLNALGFPPARRPGRPTTTSPAPRPRCRWGYGSRSSSAAAGSPTNEPASPKGFACNAATSSPSPPPACCRRSRRAPTTAGAASTRTGRSISKARPKASSGRTRMPS